MSPDRMPALFLGHGSPMNVLEDNLYTRAWQRLGETLPRPTAIVVVSAHWYTRGTGVTAMETPKTIHDFGGFPQALYDTHAPAQWQQATCTLSQPGDGVVLMTDGISDDLVADALDGFYQAMFNNVRARSRKNAQRWLGRELEQWSTPMHGDDKSLVAIFKTS